MKHFRRYLAMAPLFLAAPALAFAQQPTGVTIALQSPPASVDACSVLTGFTGRIIKLNVVEALTEVDQVNGGAKPRLASSWEQVTPETWRIKLRPDVKFHDGSDLDGDAVAYSIERTLDPAFTCDAYQRYFPTTKVTTKVIDNLTVEITTDPVQPILPTLLEGIPIISKATPRHELTRSPIGTGPFKFTKWDPQAEVLLDRNDAYWGEKPAVSQARFVWRDDSFVRASMVKLNEADIALAIADQHADDPALDVGVSLPELTRIHIHTDQAPLNDLRVRKALNLALDRESLIGVLFNKNVKPASQIVSPGTLGYNPEVKPFPYDPEQAKALVAAAKADGVDTDRPIVLNSMGGNFPNQDEVLEAFIAMWAEAGLNVSFKTLEVGQFRKALRPPFDAGRSPTFSLTNHDNLTGDAGFSLLSKYHSSSWQADVPTPSIDKLIDTGLSQGGEERRETFRKVFTEIHENIVPEVWLYQMASYVRVNPRIKFQPDPAVNSQVDLTKITFN